MPLFDPAIFDPAIFDTDAAVVGDIVQPAASFLGYQVPTATTATGNPTYPWNLFCGEVIRPSVSRVGTTLIVTLACSDYNRLWSLMKVGAPVPGNFLPPDADGVEIAIDPSARNFGPGDGGVFANLTNHYFPIVLDLVTHVHDTNPDYAFYPELDYQIASSDLAAYLTEFASMQTGSTRYWVDPDKAGHWTTVGPSPFELDFRVPAPFELDQDGPIQAGDIIQAMSLDASPDHSNLRWRVFIRGGTPASSFWVYNDPGIANRTSGEDYVDAPGAIDAATAQRIGEWHLRQNFRTLITGTAHISANDPDSVAYEGHDGWRVGQSIVVSDDVLSRLEGLPLDRYEAIITSVTGRLVSPGPGLGIEIVGLGDITDKVTRWQSLTFTEKGFGETGTATLTIEIDTIRDVLVVTAIPGDTSVTLSWQEGAETLAILPLAEIRIYTTGEAAIEYDLEWGDIPGGSLSSQLARVDKRTTLAEFVPPAYRIIWSGDKTLLPILGWVDIIGQLASASGVPEPIKGIFVAVELIQWVDLAETVVGTGFTLLSSGTDITSLETDILGRVYDRVLRDDTGDAKVFYPEGQALPIP